MVLPHQDGERVWAPNGVVPQVRLANSRPPNSIQAIAALMSQEHGVEVRCVRHVPCSDAIVVEVESDHPPSEGWIATADDVAVEAWRSTREAPNRAPWECAGWFATATKTFVGALDDRATIEPAGSRSRVRLAGTDLDQLARYVLSLSYDVEVEAPDELRGRVMDLARAVIDRHDLAMGALP